MIELEKITQFKNGPNLKYLWEKSVDLNNIIFKTTIKNREKDKETCDKILSLSYNLSTKIVECQNSGIIEVENENRFNYINNLNNAIACCADINKCFVKSGEIDWLGDDDMINVFNILVFIKVRLSQIVHDL